MTKAPRSTSPGGFLLLAKNKSGSDSSRTSNFALKINSMLIRLPVLGKRGPGNRFFVISPMRRTLLFILLCGYLPLCSQHEVDLSGIWTGTLFQNEGGIADRFELFFDVRQVGPSLKGKASVRLGDLYAEMRLSGYRSASGSWSLRETEILRSDKAGLAVSWCMKDYELRAEWKDGEWVLSGPWWGSSEYGACVPGTITLRRTTKIARALPLFGRQYAVNVEAHREVHHGNHSFDRSLPVRRD